MKREYRNSIRTKKLIRAAFAELIGEKKRISSLVSTVCGFIFVAGIASMIIMLPLAQAMLNLLNTPPEAYQGALEYSRICLLGILPIYAYHIISAIFRGMGDSKHPLIFITVACGLNIVLDIVFVLGFNMGEAIKVIPFIP